MFRDRMAAKKAACVVAGILWAGSAQTAIADEMLELAYEIHVDGSKLVDAQQTITLNAATYKSKLNMKLNGMYNTILGLEIAMTSKGVVAPGIVRPMEFSMLAETNFRDRSYAVKWDGAGQTKTFRSTELPAKRVAAIDNKLRPGLDDPITLMLQAGLSSPDRLCDGRRRAYSGIQIYEILFARIGPDTLNSDNRSIYRGPAFKCRLIYLPIAGLPPEKMTKHLKKPPKMDVWFAPVMSKRLGRILHVPVLAHGKREGEPVVAFASAATLGGQPLNGQSLAKR